MKNISKQDYEDQIKSFYSDIYTHFLNKNDIVFDLGAFKGILTTSFAKMGFNVFAFEGSPLNYFHLIENVKDFSNVTVFPFALHDHDADNVITRFNDCNGLEHPTQNINYRTLPSIMKEKNIPNPSLIKMDIEGMETVVLHSCDNLIKNIRPIWQLSTHDTYEHSKMCVYDNFPGFVNVSNGGYDFNLFLKYGYKAFNTNMIEVNSIGGFSEFFIIPIEKL